MFSSEGCGLCRALEPAVAALRPRPARGAAHASTRSRDADAWAAADVPGSPFAVALDGDGTVLAKGTFNSGARLQSVLAAAERLRGLPSMSEHFFHRLAVWGCSACAASSRAWAGAVLVTGSAPVRPAGLVAPGRGRGVPLLRPHLHDGSCPDPLGLPGSTARLPIRPRDARRIDNLGRLIDAQGYPVNEAGPAARPHRRAAAHGTADAALPGLGSHQSTNKDVRIDGGWYRCCGGTIRKLVDCCAYTQERINGDAALTGYCYAGRKVFCVLYYQTSVKC